MNNLPSPNDILLQLESLIKNQNNVLANLSNFVAIMYHSLPKINWLGFYFVEENTNDLILGPFQGKVACIRLAKGNGVCQKTISAQKLIIVNDVHTFPGHIACDPDSAAELVAPIYHKNQIIGVLDIDSPIKNRFTLQEQNLIEKSLQILNKHINWELILQLYKCELM